MSDKTYLDREDYEEPRCVLCMDAHKKEEEKVTRIDAGRMLKKLDEYFSYNDYESAERHLKFWLTEAQFGHTLKIYVTITLWKYGTVNIAF